MKIPNPNPKIGNQCNPRGPSGSQSSAAGRVRFFDVPSSTFFRLWDLGFRISVCCLLLARPGLALADPTNGLPDQIPPLRPPRAEIPPTFWEQCTSPQNRGWLLLGSALLLALVAEAGSSYSARGASPPKPGAAAPPG